MKILVLTKRRYMGKDLLDDRFGRFRELPLELARLGHQVRGLCLSYRPRNEIRRHRRHRLAGRPSYLAIRQFNARYLAVIAWLFPSGATIDR